MRIERWVARGTPRARCAVVQSTSGFSVGFAVGLLLVVLVLLIVVLATVPIGSGEDARPILDIRLR